MKQRLIEAMIDMREEDTLNIADEMLAAGTDPVEVLDASSAAMDIIGKKFEEGHFFVPELILAGEVLKQVADKTKPFLKGNDEKKGTSGKVVFGTVEGDIHDIAKDIVIFMLRINGFEVIDLGVDVPPKKFVDTVRETGAKILGLSGFLTLAYDPMKETVEAVRSAGLDDVKVMIGGGQVDDQICSYAMADAYGKDAMAAVALARQWAGQEA